MKNLFKLLSVTFLLLSFASANAQVLTPQDDGLIADQPKFYHNNQVFPYPYLREADMMYSTRHWERIDLREKINHHLYYPIKAIPDRKSLFDVLKDGILTEGTIVEVYADDRFEIPLTTEQIEGYLTRVDTLTDPDDNRIVLGINKIELKSSDVVAYNIKSDWFFDKQRGEMKNRIIGIAPVVRDPEDQNVYPLFWVWFPDARYALATHVAFNPQNNSARLTFDQIFHIRYFNAVIYKQDNVYDRTIAEYKRNQPLEQLLKAADIKEELRNYEHDLWEY